MGGKALRSLSIAALILALAGCATTASRQPSAASSAGPVASGLLPPAAPAASGAQAASSPAQPAPSPSSVPSTLPAESASSPSPQPASGVGPQGDGPAVISIAPPEEAGADSWLGPIRTLPLPTPPRPSVPQQPPVPLAAPALSPTLSGVPPEAPETARATVRSAASQAERPTPGAPVVASPSANAAGNQSAAGHVAPQTAQSPAARLPAPSIPRTPAAVPQAAPAAPVRVTPPAYAAPAYAVPAAPAPAPAHAPSVSPTGDPGAQATMPNGGSPAAQPDGGGAAATLPTGAAGGTVFARPGDDISISLDGSGWIFTGNGDWKNGLSYLTKSLDSKGTTFQFHADGTGRYQLSFLRQDLTLGTTATKEVNVTVLDEADFAKALGSGSGPSEPPAGSGDYSQAEELYQEGSLPEALAAYESSYVPGDPAVNDRIADLAFRLGKYDAAKSYWEKNFPRRGDVYGDLAAAGLAKTAVASGDTPELRRIWYRIKEVSFVPIRNELLAAGRYLSAKDEYPLADKYLEEYHKPYASDHGADEAYFLLGRLYQDDTPMQDARKAIAFYEKIIDLYPTSSYYNRAIASIAYLNRHFLDIR